MLQVKELRRMIALPLLCGVIAAMQVGAPGFAAGARKPAGAEANKPAAAKPAATAAAAPAIGTPAPATASAGSVKGGVMEIDWEALLPKDYKAPLGSTGGPPAPIHDYLGEGAPAAQQIIDFTVNKDLSGVIVKLPGFIVPLDVGKDGVVTEFFLVPYFGACIHVPPPPPNQIVYVRAAKGIALDSIYEAYWITGKMSIQSKNTRLGASAYQLEADKVEVYKY
jgi:hypothetical protein